MPKSPRPVLVLAAAACVAVGCYEFTGPGPARDLRLTGAWAFDPAVPSGGGVFLDLHAAGGTITGTGREYHFCCLYDTFTASGEYSDTSRSFALFIRYSRGASGTFAGQVFGADSLTGTWTGGNSMTWFPSTFYRELVPPCADSVPLLGTYNPAAPGYMVEFRDSVDAAAEAALLADRYGFTVQSLYQAAPKGFAAQLSPATVAVLRCESAVASIEHDGIVTTQ